MSVVIDQHDGRELRSSRLFEDLGRRFLHYPGKGGATAASRQTLDSFFVSFLFILTAAEWLGFVQAGHAVQGYVAALLSALLLWRWLFGSSTPWKLFVFAAVGVDVVESFPGGSNHFYLSVIVLMSFTICDIGQKGNRLSLLASLRWYAIIVTFYSGFKKLLFGTYFKGQYLSTVIHERGFSDALAYVTNAKEHHRLVEYAVHGAPGPYFFESPIALVVSNGVYLTEIAVAILLLWKKTRVVGAYCGIGLVLGIELIAREVVFGLIYSNLLVLFLSEHIARRWFLGTTCVALSLVPVQLWLGASTRVFN